MLQVISTVLLLAVVPSCTRPAAKMCSSQHQQCPYGQYCDLGLSKCSDCKIVCDRNNKLRNAAQCKRKCPDFEHLLINKPVDAEIPQNTSTKQTEKTTATVAEDGSQKERIPGRTEKYTKDETPKENSNLQAPLLYLLIILVVVVVVLALALVITLIVYHIKQIMETKARAGSTQGYKDITHNNNVKESLLPTKE